MPATLRGRDPRRVVTHRAIAIGLSAVVSVAGCVGTGSASPMPSASNLTSPPVPGASASVAAIPSLSSEPSHGLGISRAEAEAALDTELSPRSIDWVSERHDKDGTPLVEGWSDDGLFLSVTLAGPPHDLVWIAISGPPTTSIAEAGLALAVLHAAVPAAEGWLRASLDEPPGLQVETFGPLTVTWTRDVEWLHGNHLSMLVVSALPPVTKPTSAPLPPPTPAPTPSIDPIDVVDLLPAMVAGAPMVRSQPVVVGIPDDRAACLPLCRREVLAFAERLGVKVSSLELAVARPSGDAPFPIAVAIIRVPTAASSNLVAEWLETVDEVWPDRVLDSVLDGDHTLVVVRHELRDGPSTAWYVRWTDDSLVIVSDTSAGPIRSLPSGAVVDALAQIP